jgi:hypothetical protein
VVILDKGDFNIRASELLFKSSEARVDMDEKTARRILFGNDGRTAWGVLRLDGPM